MWKITLFVFVFLSSCHILVLVVSFSVCFLLIVSLFHFILLFLSVFLFLLPLYLFFGDSSILLLLPVDSSCFS